VWVGVGIRHDRDGSWPIIGDIRQGGFTKSIDPRMLEKALADRRKIRFPR
jgi:hypothetical protein